MTNIHETVGQIVIRLPALAADSGNAAHAIEQIIRGVFQERDEWRKEAQLAREHAEGLSGQRSDYKRRLNEALDSLSETVTNNKDLRGRIGTMERNAGEARNQAIKECVEVAKCSYNGKCVNGLTVQEAMERLLIHCDKPNCQPGMGTT